MKAFPWAVIAGMMLPLPLILSTTDAATRPAWWISQGLVIAGMLLLAWRLRLKTPRIITRGSTVKGKGFRFRFPAS